MRWVGFSRKSIAAICLALPLILATAIARAEGEGEKNLYLYLYRDARVHSQLFVKHCAEFFKDELTKEEPAAEICGGDEKPEVIPSYADVYPHYSAGRYYEAIRAFDENLEEIDVTNILTDQSVQNRIVVEWLKVDWEYYDHTSDTIKRGVGWVNRTGPGRERLLGLARGPKRLSLEARIAEWKTKHNSDPRKLLTVHSAYSFEDIFPNGAPPMTEAEKEAADGGLTPAEIAARESNGTVTDALDGEVVPKLSWFERTFFSDERQAQILSNRKKRLEREREIAKLVVTTPFGGALTAEGWRTIGQAAWDGIVGTEEVLLEGAGDKDSPPGSPPAGKATTDGEPAIGPAANETLGRVETPVGTVVEETPPAVVATPEIVAPERAKGAWERRIPEKFRGNNLANVFYGLSPPEFLARVCSLRNPSVSAQLESFLGGQGEVLHEFLRDSLAQEISGRCITQADVAAKRAAYVKRRMRELITTDAGKAKLREILAAGAAQGDRVSRRATVRSLMQEYLMDGGMPYVPYEGSKAYEQFIMGDFEENRESIEAKIAQMQGQVKCLGRPINFRDLRTISGLARVMWGEGRGCEISGDGHYLTFAKVMDDRVQATISNTDMFLKSPLAPYMHDVEALRTEPGFYARIMEESSLNKHQQFSFTRDPNDGRTEVPASADTIYKMSELEKVFSKPLQFSVLNSKKHEMSVRDITGRSHFKAGGDLAPLASAAGLRSIVGEGTTIHKDLVDVFPLFTVNLPQPKKYLDQILNAPCARDNREKQLYAEAVNLATELVCDPAKFRKDYKWNFRLESTHGLRLSAGELAALRSKMESVDWLLFYSHGFQFRTKPPTAKMRRYSCFRYAADGTTCVKWVRSIKPGMMPDKKDIELDVENFGPGNDYSYERQPQGSACPEPHYWFPMK